MTSTTPKGDAPAKKPYTLDNREANAKTRVKARCRRSSAYVTIMRVTATTPSAVIAFINPFILGRPRRGTHRARLRTPFLPPWLHPLVTPPLLTAPQFLRTTSP